MPNVLPYQRFIAPHRRNEISTSPEMLPDEISLPLSIHPRYVDRARKRLAHTTEKQTADYVRDQVGKLVDPSSVCSARMAGEGVAVREWAVRFQPSADVLWESAFS